MRFRKRPIEVEAIFWDGKNIQEVIEFSGRDDVRFANVGIQGILVIPTLEGDMLAQPGDWIIKGIAGEIYPCKPTIFYDTYEKVD